MSPKQLTALEGGKCVVGEVGDKVSPTRNMRGARLVLAVRPNLVPRARAHLRSAGSKCHGLWDNQKPDATF